MHPPSSVLSESPEAVLPAQGLLDEFLEAVPDSVYFKDADGRFLAVSRSKAARHGFTDRRLIVGKTDFDFFAAEHATRSLAEEQEIMRSGQPMVGKLQILIWPDGRQGWGLTSKLPLHDDQGRIVGTFGVTRDVTELKRVEQDLEKSQQALLHASHLAGMAEVATGVLHNVGNVLNSLNVSAELVRQHSHARPLSKLAPVVGMLRANLPDLTRFLTEDPKGKLVLDYLDALVNHEADEQRQLQEEIDSIQTYIAHIAEIVSTQQSYATTLAVLQEIAPAEACEDALRLNEASIGRHGLTIVRDYGECPRFVVQKGKLLQIIVNFLQNAKNACNDRTPPGGSKIVRVRTAATEGGIEFSVTDNGVGISPENLTQIFQQGFTTRKNGHGFGLHSCAIAAQLMGGRITAASEGPGLGATFTLRLPLQPPEIKSENGAAKLPARPAFPRVEYVTPSVIGSGI